MERLQSVLACVVVLVSGFRVLLLAPRWRVTGFDCARVVQQRAPPECNGVWLCSLSGVEPRISCLVACHL